MGNIPDTGQRAILDATQRATGNGHVLRFASMQYSQRLNAWCNSCKHCNALLYVFDVTFAVGGGAIAFNCALQPATQPATIPITDHSRRANMPKAQTFNATRDGKPCAYCGGGATLQTRCKHCSKSESATINSPQHTQRSTHTPGNNVATVYIPPVHLNAFDHTTVELGKDKQRYTYTNTQHGNYIAPCGTDCTTRHVYIPPLTYGMPDHVLAVYECPVCDNYKCIAVLITPGNAY